MKELLAWSARTFQVGALVMRPRELNVRITMDNLQTVLSHYAQQVESKYHSIRAASMFEIGELDRYVRTLTWLRVQRVNRKVEQSYDVRVYPVPALIALILRQIGRVHDDAYGFDIVPQMDKPEDIMGHSEALGFSKVIRSFREAFSIEEFPTTGESGDPMFMSKVILNAVVLSYRRDDPQLYAYLAYLAGNTLVEAAASSHFFVTYGDCAWYDNDSPVGVVEKIGNDAPDQSPVG